MQRQGGKRRKTKRVELRIAFTRSTDIAFGITLRAPRRRPRSRGHLREWGRAAGIGLCIVVAGLGPSAVAASGDDLGRLAGIVLPERAHAARLVPTLDRPRPVLRARAAPMTAVRKDPPALEAHVVAPGETLLSIAAQYGITPQTLAYNNRLSDTAALRVGESIVVPPLDAAIYVVNEGDTIAQIAARYGAEPDRVRALNSVVFEPEDVTPGRVLLVPMPDGRYPGFRLLVHEAPRVLTPRVAWPTNGVVTQLFSAAHTGVDIAAPYGSPVVASGSGTVTWVGWRGDGGLAVCVLLDWGLETCDYHLSATNVELGERVVAGERIAAVGSSGVSTGPHVHWEARTNGVLVDPMTYAPANAAIVRVGGATGSP